MIDGEGCLRGKVVRMMTRSTMATMVWHTNDRRGLNDVDRKSEKVWGFERILTREKRKEKTNGK